jgi:tetratricopeptide (TPR) repeat protein
MSDRLVIEEIADGQVRVSLHRHEQEPEDGAAVPFALPFTDVQREDLRWYLEDYLIAPYAVYEERGQQIRDQLPKWGEALFDSLFGAGKPGRDLYMKAQGTPELALRSRSAEFLSLPWELIKDTERATPFALAMSAFDRTMRVAGSAIPVPSGEVLRVLMVVARPAGLKDVGYQMVARPLLQRLDAVCGKVALEVLRPPTLNQLNARLRAAVDAGTPFHILHFDGHGTFGTVAPAGMGRPTHYDPGSARGFLVFEAPGGGDQLVSADQFAVAASEGRVPLIVLNACRSAMLGQRSAVEAAVATRLLEGGIASVVAMGYSVYAVAAAEFMAEFYETLFDGGTVSTAVVAGRQRLFRNQNRPSPKGPMPLEDWIVPVHYLRRAIAFPQLQRPRKQDSPSLDARLQEARRVSTATVSDDPLAPERQFIGRDAAFYELEQVLRQQRLAVVHGSAGTGKTELAKAFGRWWQTTGGVERSEWVFFYAFDPGLVSFGLDGALTEIGLRLYGPNFLVQTRDAPERYQLLLKDLRERRMLLIWDNFESVCTLPDLTGATPPLDGTGREQMRVFLTALARHGKSTVIITSRTEELWLGNVRRVELGGLTLPEAVEMAESVLIPYATARQRQREPEFPVLLEALDGHPLSLRLLLPHLEHVSPTVLLQGLKGYSERLPPGFVGEGRTHSLGASLAYSFDHLSSEQREQTLVLGLFEGIVNEVVLELFSNALPPAPRFAKLDEEKWKSLLQRLVSLGILTALDSAGYGLHPALPAWLIAAWRDIAGANFVAERDAAEQALLTAYAIFGEWLREDSDRGFADKVFSLIDGQRRTMARLLGLALSKKQYAHAQALIQPLNDFWDHRGLWQEADGWVDRCRILLETPHGTPPGLESDAGHLWLHVVGSKGNRAIQAGQLDVAAAIYDTVREWLEASGEEGRKYLSATYHQLGGVAQYGGDLAGAEKWYRRSLEIAEVFNDRGGTARSYHQLGVVAQHCDDLAGAKQLYHKALEIEEELGDLFEIANTYHHLGIVTHMLGDLDAAEQWFRKGLGLFERLNDRNALGISYHELGIVAQDRGDLDGAERWYREALVLFAALDDRRGLGFSYQELGRLAKRRGDLPGAEQWHRKSVEMKEAVGDRREIAISYLLLGQVVLDRGDLNGAEEAYRQALKISESLDDRRVAGIYHQLGVIAQLRGDFDTAEQWYCGAIEFEERLGDRSTLALTYGQLGLLAKDRGDASAALDWTVRCVALFEALPHPATRRAPADLIRLTAELGMPALRAAWRRCIGADLPSEIAQMVANAAGPE